MNTHFMKKLPPGAETSNILVGELSSLDKPISCFLRLQESVMLGDLTEVPVPTRFIFILLGPGVSQYLGCNILHKKFFLEASSYFTIGNKLYYREKIR